MRIVVIFHRLIIARSRPAPTARRILLILGKYTVYSSYTYQGGLDSCRITLMDTQT